MNYEYIPGQIYNLVIADLKPHPYQPRKYIDQIALEELKTSIISCGVINPIIFTILNGVPIIVAGHRRCQASQAVGLEKIQAKYADPAGAHLIMISENLFREDLSVMEQAEGILLMKEEGGLVLKEVAGKLGMPVSSLSELLSLCRLPEDIKAQCRGSREYKLSPLVVIARAKDPEQMRRQFKHYQKKLRSNSSCRKEKKCQPVDALIARLDEMATQLLKIDLNAMGGEETYRLLLKLSEIERIISHKATGVVCSNFGFPNK